MNIDQQKKYGNKLYHKWKKTNIRLYKKFLEIAGFSGDKTSRNLFRLLQLALLFAIAVLLINLFFNHGESKLGEWGDFFGGVLNPLLTFLTFIGLLITIILQQKEFHLSRKEFQGQKEALENQEFDNKFFQMLGLLNKIISNLSIPNESSGKSVFKILINKFVEDFRLRNPNNLVNPPVDSLKNFEVTFATYNNKYDESFKYYFLNLFQILNYIDKNSTDKYPLKEYANIVRAQLSKNELILLFFNAIGIRQFSGAKYKAIIEKYSFFEHLTYHDLTRYDEENKENSILHIQDLVNLILIEYDKKAFGQNQDLLKKWGELKSNNK